MQGECPRMCEIRLLWGPLYPNTFFVHQQVSAESCCLNAPWGWGCSLHRLSSLPWGEQCGHSLPAASDSFLQALGLWPCGLSPLCPLSQSPSLPLPPCSGVLHPQSTCCWVWQLFILLTKVHVLLWNTCYELISSFIIKFLDVPNVLKKCKVGCFLFFECPFRSREWRFPGNSRLLSYALSALAKTSEQIKQTNKKYLFSSSVRH